MNRPTLIVSLLIVAGTLILMGTTYAYFTATATSNEQQTTSGTLELTYETGQDIQVEEMNPTEETNAATHKFTVKNTGTLPANYYIYLTNISLTKDSQATTSQNLKWKLTEATKSGDDYVESTMIASGDFSSKMDQVELARNISIPAGQSDSYILKVWLQETGAPQNEDQSITFSANIEVTTDTRELVSTFIPTEEAVLDNIASTYVTSPTGIDFSQISSDTNGKGLYILHGTENNTYPIYYYRGDVENNNVKFANFCWKIVRTTETGGTKLIYNGTPDGSGNCTNTTGEATQIGTSAFNSQIDDNAYVGYMYGTPNSSTYEETHANINDSTIKGIIDTWYQTNLLNYTSYLEDTVWCNDRSIDPNKGSLNGFSSPYTTLGYGNNNTVYGAGPRVGHNLETVIPELTCPNSNDRFTVSIDNGNGALTYPVALLTADEVAFAGAVTGVDNTNYYLYIAKLGWTITPYVFSTDAGNFYMGDSLSLDNLNSNTVLAVRPAISLKAGTTAISGDGTASNPYVIE